MHMHRLDAHTGSSYDMKEIIFLLMLPYIDMTIINAWVLYGRVKKAKGETKMTQKNFRIEVASTLCKLGRTCTPKLSRPSSAGGVESIRKKSAAPKPSTPVCTVETLAFILGSKKFLQKCRMQVIKK